MNVFVSDWEKCPREKFLPGKMFLRKLLPEKLHPLPRKFPTGELPPMKPFYEFFLISSFCFHENFRPKEKSIFIQSLFLL